MLRALIRKIFADFAAYRCAHEFASEIDWLREVLNAHHRGEEISRGHFTRFRGAVVICFLEDNPPTPATL